MITVTDKAFEKVKTMLQSENKTAEHGLRIGVRGGGCSGLEYMMDFDVAHDGDKVYEKDGVKVILDPKSSIYISGSVVDYVESLQGSGFAIKNPKVKSSCGCGKSFNT